MTEPLSGTDFVLLVGGVVFAVLGGMLGLIATLLLRRWIAVPSRLGFQLLIGVVVVIATYFIMVVIASVAFEDLSFSLRSVLVQLGRMRWQGYVLFAIEALAAILVARRLVRRRMKVDPAVFD